MQIVPVKAMAVVPLRRIFLDAQGAAEDRRLFLLRHDGTVATSRRYPQLARVVPDLNLAAGSLTLTFPDGTTATSELTGLGERVHSRVFEKDRDGQLVGGPVAAALSGYLNEPVRMALTERAGIGWDEGPVSLLGRASAQAVEAPDAHPSSSTARFRMLVEVDGIGAHEEDTWIGRDVRLGNAAVSVSHPPRRCVVINNSPVTGVKDWDGLRILAAHQSPHRMCLGVIANVANSGDVSVGDTVEMLAAES